MKAFVTGADHGLGYAVTEALLARGWDVIAGQFKPERSDLTALAERSDGRLQIVPLDISSIDSVRNAAALAAKRTASIDLLINDAGISAPGKQDTPIEGGLDYASIQRTIDVNTLGALRVTEAFLPLVQASTLKRLCYVSSEAGSIAKSHRTGWYAYCMSKAALNMGVSIVFNDLRPKGFSFRVYHPGWMQTWMGGNLNTNATYPADEAAVRALRYFLEMEIDEDRLVMHDEKGEEWPW